MASAAPLLVVLLLAPGADPQPEAPPASVKEVLDKYLKAVAAKDLPAMTALADVPWLDRDRQLVRDRTGLGKALERVVIQLPKDEGRRLVETVPYKKARDHFKDEALRKLLDEVLGEDGWLAAVEEDGYALSLRVILIRVKGDKAAVVAGPLKQNQITLQNRIPEVVERLFDKAEMFELFSLDPKLGSAKEGKGVKGKDYFYGWQVLGKTEVKGEAERKRLADALQSGAEDNHGAVEKCFIPRHGVRLKGGGKTVDLVICFECLQVEVFVDGKREKGFLTSGEPQQAFDATLKTAGVPLPKRAKK
jgi:hypothetical protein